MTSIHSLFEDLRRGAGHVPDRNGHIADVVLPVANALRKGRHVHQHCGDLQMTKKAGDIAGVRSDFEFIVRIAEPWDTPSANGALSVADCAPTPAISRGAQSGEADRHGSVARRA